MVSGIGNLSSLGMLLKWFRSRDEGHPLGVQPDIPSDDVTRAEFSELCKRLRTAYAEQHYQRRWLNASGVVIMKDVLTQPRFYDGCQRYLHLWVHCATKTI